MKNVARKIKSMKSQTVTPSHGNLAELIFDSGAFDGVLATSSISNLEHLKADTAAMGETAKTIVVLAANNDFSEQPLSYVLTVHLRNILKSNCVPVIVKRHVANLCATYGREHVAQCMRVFFPNMFDSYGHLTK